MKEIKCGCRDNKCAVTLKFVDGNLIVTDANGREQLIFLDSNAITSLVFEAKQALLEKVFGT